MTDAILNMVQDWTGSKPPTCPWRVFEDPLVREVLEAWRFFEKGALALFRPEPSYRLMMGISCLAQAMDDVRAKQAQQRLDEAKESAARAKSGHHG